MEVAFGNKIFKIPNDYTSDDLSGVLRPEHIIFNPENNENIVSFEGTIEIISYQGALIRYIINADGFKFTSEFSNLPKSKQYSEGEQVKFGFDKNNLVIV